MGQSITWCNSHQSQHCCVCAGSDEAAGEKPAEGAARNGAKRKRIGNSSKPGAAHSPNGIPGASGEAGLHTFLHICCSFLDMYSKAAMIHEKTAHQTRPEAAGWLATAESRARLEPQWHHHD